VRRCHIVGRKGSRLSRHERRKKKERFRETKWGRAGDGPAVIFRCDAITGEPFTARLMGAAGLCAGALLRNLRHDPAPDMRGGRASQARVSHAYATNLILMGGDLVYQ